MGREPVTERGISMEEGSVCQELDPVTRVWIGMEADVLEGEEEYYQAIIGIERRLFEYRRVLSRQGGVQADEEKRGYDILKYRLWCYLEGLERKHGIVRTLGVGRTKLESGQREYGEWYREREQKGKEKKVKEWFEANICGACPFRERALTLVESVPCTLYPKAVAALERPWQCLMTDGRHCKLRRTSFSDLLYEAGGEDAVIRFGQKEAELKRRYIRQAMEQVRRTVRKHNSKARTNCLKETEPFSSAP